MKLNIKEIDFKQFFIEHGEKIGLAVAGGLTVLLLLLTILGFLSADSPDAKKTAMNKEHARITSSFNNAKPSETDNPPLRTAKIEYADLKGIPGTAYLGDPYFTDDAVAPPKRRMPRVLPVSEDAYGAVALLPIKSLVVDNSDKAKLKVLVLKDYKGPTMAGPGAGGIGGLGAMGGPGGIGGKGMLPGGAALGGASPGGAGVAGANAPAAPGPGQRAGIFGMFKGQPGKKESPLTRWDEDTRPIYQADWVSELDFESGKYQPAIDVKAARVAMLVATFPLSDQGKEFAEQLRLPEGLSETPYFRGVEVQRCERNVDGTWSEYKAVEARKIYDLYRNLAFNQFEPEDDNLLDMIQIQSTLSGATLSPVFWKRPKSVFDKMYPDLEKNLGKVTQRLAQAETNKLLQDQRKRRKSLLDRSEDDAANQSMASGSQGEGGGGMGAMMAGGMGGKAGGGMGAMMAGGMGGKAGGGMPGGMGGFPGGAGGGQGASATADLPPPEDCLVRVLDYTIESGKVYKYRMRMVLQNPNYQRPDVALESFAKPIEIPGTDASWRELPPVVSPAEQVYYVAAPMVADTNAGQAVLEVHQWVEKATVGGSEPVDVGQWVVMPRQKIRKGDYIGGLVGVQGVPTWSRAVHGLTYLHQKGSKSTGAGNRPTVNLPVGPGQGRDLILADVEGPYFSHQRFSRKGDLTKSEKIDDPRRPVGFSAGDNEKPLSGTWTEVLFLTPGGKLIAHNSAVDEANAERKASSTLYQDHLKEVTASIRSATAPASTGGAPGSTGGAGGK